jgi:hypothetical protein
MPDDSIASYKGLRRLVRRLLHLSDNAPRPEDMPGPGAPGSASQALADRSPLRLAYEIGRAFAEKSQLDELIPFAIARCREILDAEGVAVLLYDQDADELYFPFVAAEDPAVLQIRFPADCGIAGTVLRSLRSLRVDDASIDPRFFAGVDQQTGQTTRALLCAPLISPAGVVGVIEAVNLRGTAVFTDDDLALLDGLAQSLAAAIHNAKKDGDQVSGVRDRDEELQDLRLEPQNLKPGSVFRKEGEYWTIEFEGAVARLKDAKGLHYIGYLLRHPGQEFHVRELLAAVSDAPVPPEKMEAAQAVGQGLSVSGLGDAGPMLDAKAKAEYKSRLDDLREELEEAERFNDPGRASRAQEEMEFITGQLTAAVGLGGRDRVGASDAERARLAVTKRIKAAMGKIRQANPALERHLAGAITTGYFCSYTPTADTSISWSF